MLKVNVKRLTDTATLPTYGSDRAACMDLYADISTTFNEWETHEDVKGVKIQPHTCVKIGTGLAFQPPAGYYGAIYARSGMSTKKGLRLANNVGICDEDYRGEYIIPIYNDSNETQIIKHGERIAQLVFVPYEQSSLIVVPELDETARGDGGFGSSGV